MHHEFWLKTSLQCTKETFVLSRGVERNSSRTNIWCSPWKGCKVTFKWA
uniref:Uncharacterized protein n=1 Tax=Rhizophora mucronata TaxID=61149 RepID=A0A2P2JQ02_RHIMU